MNTVNISSKLKESISDVRKRVASRVRMLEGEMATARSVRNLLGLESLPETAPELKFDIIACPSGATLFRQGMPAEYIYIVIEGAMKTCNCADDEMYITLDILFKGDIVGGDSFGSEHYLTSAIALSEVFLVRMATAQFRTWCRCGGNSYDEVLSLISKKNIQAGQIRLLKFRHMTGRRLAFYLVALMRRLESAEEGMASIQIFFPRIEMAAFLGMSNETLCRQLAVLKRAQLVRYERRWISVLDLVALQDFAQHGDCVINYDWILRPAGANVQL